MRPTLNFHGRHRILASIFRVLSIVTTCVSLYSCGSKSKAADPADIECMILNAWDFQRCENSEVICYTNEKGLSCKWKS